MGIKEIAVLLLVLAAGYMAGKSNLLARFTGG